MQDFQQKIERLIFLQNYTNPLLSKEAALMCIHSALMRREEVPRIYLVDSPQDKQNWIWSSISSCLLTDHRVVMDWTLASLKLLHVQHSDFRKLSHESRFECIRMIEENLSNTLGSGRLYYEMSRFTPFVNDDITQLLLESEAPREIWQTTLYSRLRERSLAKIQYHQKHADMLHKLNLRGDWDMFHSVYKFKLEQLWQKAWLDSSKYQVHPNIISTISVGDDFED